MQLTLTLNLLVAISLGALIGIERQWRQRFTGLATHALVALGAAGFCSLPAMVDMESSPIRMGSQVVSGIGFLGAGVIMRDGLSVRGLSTAATVWATGAVGVLAGYGFLIAATETAALILIGNLILPPLGRFIGEYAPKPIELERFYLIGLTCDAKDEAAVRARLLAKIADRNLRLSRLESHAIEGSTRVTVDAVVFAARQQDALVEEVVGTLSLEPSITAASWGSADPPA